MANVFFKSLGLASAALLMTGCVVYTRPAPAPVVTEVVAEPGVEVVEVEPAPEERVYVYEPGYPPGCYFVGGYYWYNGARYEHDVFINRYVTVNIRQGRYTNVEENRRIGARIEVQHRQSYAKAQAEHREAARTQSAHAEEERPATARPKVAKNPQRPAQPMAAAR